MVFVSHHLEHTNINFLHNLIVSLAGFLAFWLSGCHTPCSDGGPFWLTIIASCQVLTLNCRPAGSQASPAASSLVLALVNWRVVRDGTRASLIRRSCSRASRLRLAWLRPANQDSPLNNALGNAMPVTVVRQSVAQISPL